jgi:hypothetical protein
MRALIVNISLRQGIRARADNRHAAGRPAPDPKDETTADFLDSRIKDGVLLAAPGRCGSDLRPETATRLPFPHPSFAEMTTPALIVAGCTRFAKPAEPNRPSIGDLEPDPGRQDRQSLLAWRRLTDHGLRHAEPEHILAQRLRGESRFACQRIQL